MQTEPSQQQQPTLLDDPAQARMERPNQPGLGGPHLAESEAADDRTAVIRLKLRLLNLPAFQDLLRNYAACLKIGASPEFLAAVDGFDPVAALQLKYSSDGRQKTGCSAFDDSRRAAAAMDVPGACRSNEQAKSNEQARPTSFALSVSDPTTRDSSETIPDPATSCAGLSKETRGATPFCTGLRGARLAAEAPVQVQGLGAAATRSPGWEVATQSPGLSLSQNAGSAAALEEWEDMGAVRDFMASLTAAMAASRDRLLSAHTVAEAFLLHVESSLTANAGDATSAAAAATADGAAAAAAAAAAVDPQSSSTSSSSSSGGDGAGTSRGSDTFMGGEQEGVYDDIMADISTSQIPVLRSQEQPGFESGGEAEAAVSAAAAGDGSEFGGNPDMGLTLSESVEDIESMEQVERLVRARFGGFLRTVSAEHVVKHVKGKLPDEATGKLLAWWNDHINWPYPTEQEKLQLMSKTGLDSRQVNNWFINQRKRHWNQQTKRQKK
ncbi:hypothetical protein CLOM_g6196 [Closterium sp. NIES-68]|nr:hypothetical protein CLOM_g6196 [Closterium sp. NIES-68]GJP73054.1 hypothetical protein CLOP_g3808 [Closterium sp. NIES-67]